jgi:TatD DNase family protein
MNYINIHTHHIIGTGFQIVNQQPPFVNEDQHRFYSAGIHPWYIHQNNWQHDLLQLKNRLQHKNVLALGECGLDKICETPFLLQKEVFAAQVQLANIIQKPLLLHVVKAHQDVLQILQQQHNQVPVIFHGFNNSERVAQQLLQSGAYLSFGKAVQHPRIASLIPKIAADRFFLETDDAAVEISTLYKTVADLRNISVEALSLQLQNNAKHIFKI